MTTAEPAARIPGSFRDPSGFLFVRDGVLYRQVDAAGRDDYERLMASGLYRTLVEAGRLIPHEEAEGEPLELPSGRQAPPLLLRPARVPMVSYPYEWCFSQLKDAALLTLEVQKTALSAGMILKDASAFNVQFIGCRPVWIDTLSFAVYREGQAWDGYRQFCQHFVAPLALISRRHALLSRLLPGFCDGLPLDLASRLLPGSTWLRFGLLSHVHLHARSQQRFAGRPVGRRQEGDVPRTAEGSRRMGVSRMGLLGLIDSLERTVRRLTWRPTGTAWADYYPESASYSAAALEHKKALVAEFLDQVRPASVWDLGANTGLFSRLAARRGIPTVGFDADPGAVEQSYLLGARQGEANLLPLLMDLTNPSPALGWENRERLALGQRGPAEMVLALALVHHLAIANNVPLERIAAFLAGLTAPGGTLAVEFVPKEDAQVQRLLASRADIFPDYTAAGFEGAFGQRFVLLRCEPIRDGNRTLYVMAKG